MTRMKVKLDYIDNDSVRRSTFNKRKRGFMKKINELSVLCGIEACALIYNPFTSTPEMWPSQSGMQNVVERFLTLPPIDQGKKMVNHEGFLKERIAKEMNSNNKKVEDNKERTMREVMFSYLGGKGNELTLNVKSREELVKYIDQYLEELSHHKKVILTQPVIEYGESSSPPEDDVMAITTTTNNVTTITEVGSEANI